jgi:hypothetical protein
VVDIDSYDQVVEKFTMIHTLAAVKYSKWLAEWNFE